MTETGPGPSSTVFPTVMAVTAGLLFGASVVATRFVVQQSDPLTIATLRYLIGFGSMAPFYLMPRLQRKGIRQFAKGDLLPLTVLGVVFFGIIPFTFTLGLNYTYASRGGLVLAFGPLLTLLLATLLKVEAMTPAKLAGVVLAIVGALLALAGTGALDGGLAGSRSMATLWLGDGIMLLTMVFFAIYNVFAHGYLRRYGALPVILHCLLSGTVFLLLAYLALRGAWPTADLTPAGWGALIFIAIPGGAMGFALYIVALGRLSPARAAVFYNLNPVTAVALGAMFLGEPLTLSFWAGFILVVGGILSAQWDRFRPRGNES